MRRDRGLTLVEVIVAMTILAAVLGMFYAMLFRSTTTYTNVSRMGNIQENGRRVLDEMANELRLADRATIVITNAGTGASQTQTVNFRIPTAFAPPNVTWSAPIEYRFETAPVNMVQGVTGEGRAVRLEGGRRRTLCDYVKPGGLRITRTGNNLTIRLVLVVNDERNKILETSVETSVTLRNSST